MVAHHPFRLIENSAQDLICDRVMRPMRCLKICELGWAVAPLGSSAYPIDRMRAGLAEPLF